jgi:hypothetical protein
LSWRTPIVFRAFLDKLLRLDTLDHFLEQLFLTERIAQFLLSFLLLNVLHHRFAQLSLFFPLYDIDISFCGGASTPRLSPLRCLLFKFPSTVYVLLPVCVPVCVCFLFVGSFVFFPQFTLILQHNPISAPMSPSTRTGKGF